jgi:hypothetical protein
MVDFIVYVLTSLSIDAKGDVTSKNVGVTFNIHDAEAHKGEGVENDFEMFTVPGNWREDAEVTATVLAMRAFREIVALQVEEALR